MAKTIFEEMGGKYERQGDYLIPCLTVSAEEEQPIGIWGQRHLDYLKHHCKVTYTNLLTSGRLNAYLADIDRQAQEGFERLIEGMKQAQGITEQLKAETNNTAPSNTDKERYTSAKKSIWPGVSIMLTFTSSHLTLNTTCYSPFRMED